MLDLCHNIQVSYINNTVIFTLCWKLRKEKREVNAKMFCGSFNKLKGTWLLSVTSTCPSAFHQNTVTLSPQTHNHHSSNTQSNTEKCHWLIHHQVCPRTSAVTLTLKLSAMKTPQPPWKAGVSYNGKLFIGAQCGSSVIRKIFVKG